MFFPDDVFSVSFGFIFNIVPLLVMLGFIFVFGMIIVNAIKGAKQWNYNNSQPVLTVEARIVTKRADVSTYHHSNHNDIGHHHHHSSTTYYVTFEVQSGDRMEFRVSANEYGMLVEGDFGNLTFQGTRYLGFNRILS
ncbi:DUF2500 domain-containing protein [Clostridium thermarum]|uniref:DUF2500 domain-containing protein n=1 Tax=Clostridium thermarum TaxID=1716543 RepID=UPI00111D23B9|nr:DUF2500 domain-containing protein [Clostridium thermarum]